MKRQLFFLVLLLLFALMVMEAPAQRKEGWPLREKVLHVAISMPINGNFDPVESNYINLQPLYRAIYGTLFKLNAQLQPYFSLAESMEQSDEFTYILQIKKDAVFSNGMDITAMDVIRSIEKGMSTINYPTPLLKLIEGGEDFWSGKSAHCSGLKWLGPKRVEIHLKEKNAQFSHYLTAMILAILPQQRNQKTGLNGYSGAFAITDINKKKKETVVTLKRNPHYFGKRSKVETIYFHFYATTTDFEQAIDSGRPDLFLCNEFYKIPSSKTKYNYFKTPIYGTFYLQLNPIKGPFKDKSLRKFFQEFILSLDICNSMGWELTTPAMLVLPHGLPGYSIFKQMVPEDFSKHIPARRVKIIAVNSTSKIKEVLFDLLKLKLSPFNVELELQWESEAGVLQREKSGDYDILSYLYMVDVPLSSFFYRTLFSPGYVLNVARYEVPDAFRLLESYQRESDELIRLRILSRLEDCAQEEAVLIPVMTPLSILGYKQNIQNVKIDKYLTINFEEIDVK